ncbi:MAG: hypothetical protein AB7R55_10590 [Gemmatimonadales bacterium]
MEDRSFNRESGKANAVLLAAVLVLGAAAVLSKRGGEEPVEPVPAERIANDPAANMRAAQAAARRADSVRNEVIRQTRAGDRREYAPPPPSSATLDPNRLVRLDAALRDVRRLVDAGRREAMAIPEAEADAGLNSSAARSATAQWDQWSRTWSQRIDQAGKQLGGAGQGIGFDDPAYQVYQEISFCLNDLRAVAVNPASTTNIPLKSRRQSQFDAAADRLNRAASTLAGISRR